MSAALAPLYWCAVGLYGCAAVYAVGYILRPKRFRPTVGRLLAGAGFVLHTAALAVLAARSGNIPVNNVFQSFVFLLWCLALVGLVMDGVYKLPAAGAFLLAALALLALKGVYFVGDEAELPREITLLWQLAHIVPIFLGFAAFGLAFVLSLMYLVQQRQIKSKAAGALLDRLPSLEVLDRASGIAIAWGFPLLTLGILFGLVWLRSQHLLLDAPHRDPKVLGGFATWLVYAVVLHLRLRVRLHGRRIALLTVASFLLVLVTFSGGFFVGGRHAFRPPEAHPPSHLPR